MSDTKLDQPHRSEIHALHANLCSGVADPSRIAMLYALRGGPRMVSDLVRELDMPQSSVSRHLRVLRDRQLVQSRREGTHVFYQLTDARVLDALDILRAVLRDRLESRGELADAL